VQATPVARSPNSARRSSAQRKPSPPRNPARRDALGRRAAEGVPDSQSASERGESAKREKPPRTRLASSGGQLTQRSERDARRAARLGRLLSGTRLWSGSGFSAENPRYPAPGAVGQRKTELGGNTPSPTRPTSAANAQRTPPSLPPRDLAHAHPVRSFSDTQYPPPEAQSVQGAVQPEDRHPLPATRRGVML